MKNFCLGILVLSALSCGKNSDSKTVKAAHMPQPSAEQNPLEGFGLSNNQAYQAKIVWNNPPVSASFDNSAEVYFTDQNGQSATSSSLTRFRLYMVTMGHPSIKESEMVLTQVAPDHWRASRIFFAMGGSPGSWVVDVEAVVNGLPDKIRLSIDHEVQ